MAEVNKTNLVVVTPKFRVSYPNVFQAKLNDLSGKMEYSLVALFAPDEDLSKLKKVFQAAVFAKFGEDQKKWPKDPKTGKVVMNSPFRDQGDRAKHVEDEATGNTRLVLPDGYVKGAIMLNLKSKDQPGLVDRQNQDIIQPSDFYAGCYARAQVYAHAYSSGKNHGVAFYVNNIQKVADGEPFSGRMKATDAFEALDEGETSAASDASEMTGGSLFD